MGLCFDGPTRTTEVIPAKAGIQMLATFAVNDWKAAPRRASPLDPDLRGGDGGYRPVLVTEPVV